MKQSSFIPTRKMDDEELAVAKLNRLCKVIGKMSDSEIQILDAWIQKQVNYVHPLKYAQAAKVQELGRYNSLVLQSVKATRSLIQKRKKGNGSNG